MQDQVTQLSIHPFIKLAQANMELITRFSTSSEMASQSTAIAQSFIQQSQQAAASIVQSGAFTQLRQGMLENYTEFLIDVSQSAMTAFVQAPAAMLAGAQEVTGNVIDVAEARGRRGRRTA